MTFTFNLQPIFFRTTIPSFVISVIILMGLFSSFGISESKAQSHASLVPLTHPVYSWLEYQRNSGRITGYHPELTPYSRGKITAFLRTIEQSNRPLSRWEQQILQSYLREFDAELLYSNNYLESWRSRENLSERLLGFWHDQPEPYLYRFTTEERQIEAYVYGLQARAKVDARDDGEWRWAQYYIKGVKGFMNVGNHVGFHAEIDNVYALGDQLLLRLDPDWGTSAAIDWRWRERASYSYETFANLEFPLVRLTLGRGSLNFGPHVSEPLVFSRTAPNMSWIRYDIGNEKINLAYMHAALQSYPENVEMVINGETITSRTLPERWLIMRRFTLEPIPQITFGFYEVVLYSNRSIDLGYLNPVVPYFFLESDQNRDADQLFAGIDLRVRPFQGTTLFGTLFMDDFYTFEDTFRFNKTVQSGNVGLIQTLPFSSELGISFTRIDPNMYGHKFRLNSFEVNGQVLGHSIGPNATEWAWRWQTWLPYRSSITLKSSYVKKGMNPVDEDGNIIESIGADFLENYAYGRKTLFEGADMHFYYFHRLEVQTEPIRGLQLKFRWWYRDVRKGEQITDLRYFDFTFGFGF